MCHEWSYPLAVSVMIKIQTKTNPVLGRILVKHWFSVLPIFNLPLESIWGFFMLFGFVHKLYTNNVTKESIQYRNFAQ